VAATSLTSWTDNSSSETSFIVQRFVNGEWVSIADSLVERPIADADGPITNTQGEVLTYQLQSFAVDDQIRVVAQNTVGDTWDYSLNVNGQGGWNGILPPTPGVDSSYAFPVVTVRGFSTPVLVPAV
jgi:hypothetical protein